MIYGKARSTTPQLRLRLRKRAPKIQLQPALPVEIILEILRCRADPWLKVAKWTNYEAKKIIAARPKITVYARNISYLTYTMLEGMAGLKYSA